MKGASKKQKRHLWKSQCLELEWRMGLIPFSCSVELFIGCTGGPSFGLE